MARAFDGAQRLLQHAIKSVGDEIPNPWERRIEFVFRQIGGLIWLQITLLVMGLRILLSLIAAIGHAISRHDGMRGEVWRTDGAPDLNRHMAKSSTRSGTRKSWGAKEGMPCAKSRH